MSWYDQYFTQDASENRIGRGGTTASGAFGDVPQQLIDKKYEQTDIYEDVNELDTYHRGMLMHQGPDPALFEEEQVRRDNHSESRLNIRHHGSRSQFKPYHPEIFTELTERDPRGTATGPDMRKLVDQNRYRMSRYIKFYNDEDLSVPESHRSEAKVIKDKRNMFYWVKDKMKWFSTSHDNRAAGRTMGYKTGRDINLITNSAELIDLNVGRNHIHRGDQTTILSNYYPMGWYKTTDHRFSVAKYGPSYKMKKINDNDFRKIKNEIKPDHSDVVEWKESAQYKSIVHEMKRITTENTQRLPANYLLSIDEKIRSMTRVMKREGIKADDTTVDHKVIDQMVSAIRHAVTGSTDAEGLVVRSSLGTERKRDREDDISKAIRPTDGEFKLPHINRRRAMASVNGVELKTKDYSGLKPKIKDNYLTANNNGKYSNNDDRTMLSTKDYRVINGIRKKNMNRKDDFHGDGKFSNFGTLDRKTGRREKKVNTRKMSNISHTLDEGMTF